MTCGHISDLLTIGLAKVQDLLSVSLGSRVTFDASYHTLQGVITLVTLL